MLATQSWNAPFKVRFSFNFYGAIQFCMAFLMLYNPNLKKIIKVRCNFWRIKKDKIIKLNFRKRCNFMKPSLLTILRTITSYFHYKQFGYITFSIFVGGISC